MYYCYHCVFSGEFKEGLAHGHGQATYYFTLAQQQEARKWREQNDEEEDVEDEEEDVERDVFMIYEGQWQGGLKHGWGQCKYYHPHKTACCIMQYTGEYRDGKRHGMVSTWGMG